jgi:hypothetical protein
MSQIPSHKLPAKHLFRHLKVICVMPLGHILALDKVPDHHQPVFVLGATVPTWTSFVALYSGLCACIASYRRVDDISDHFMTHWTAYEPHIPRWKKKKIGGKCDAGMPARVADGYIGLRTTRYYSHAAPKGNPPLSSSIISHRSGNAHLMH